MTQNKTWIQFPMRVALDWTAAEEQTTEQFAAFAMAAQRGERGVIAQEKITLGTFLTNNHYKIYFLITQKRGGARTNTIMLVVRHWKRVSAQTKNILFVRKNLLSPAPTKPHLPTAVGMRWKCWQNKLARNSPLR